jgi:hypothetical protein
MENGRNSHCKLSFILECCSCGDDRSSLIAEWRDLLVLPGVFTS